MSTAVKPEAQAFLDRFFTEPNHLKPDSKPELPRWVARLSGPEPLPTVLPCWRGGQIVDWYGLAFNDRELRSLGESLTAFVGPSYATFRGQLANLDPGDPIDKAVLDLSAGNAFKFRGEDPAQIWRLLERMRKVWERQGERKRENPSPVGHVLRDFYMAIRAGDRAAAEETLTRLREWYHVDGVNVLYLRVQLLEAFGVWSELLSLREIPDLLRLRRPVAVTEALLRAVYHEHLSSFEVPPAPGAAAEVFTRDVLSRYGSLFTARAGMHSAEAAKGFMLLAVTRTPPNLSLRDELLARRDLPTADAEYLRKLAALVSGDAAKPPEGNLLPLALKAAETSDFDRAFSLALAAPPSPARAKLLCECAFELGTLEARSTAVAAVSSLPEEERATFLGRRLTQSLWESLRGEEVEEQAAQAAPMPTDCCSWLEHLDQHEGRVGSREIVRHGATEWSLDDFLRSPGTIERFAERLQAVRSQAAELALRDSLPHLLLFFRRDLTWPNPEMKSIYRSMLEILCFSTDGGRSDLVVFNELAEALLTIGVSAAEYRELLPFMCDLWNRFAAPATFDWAADALELLVASPCPDATLRQSFLQAILDRAAHFSRHIAIHQQDILRLIASDLGVIRLVDSYFPSHPDVARDETDAMSNLNGRAIAVYTLTARAAEQFRRVIEGRAPGTTVTLLHDLDGSKRLEQHARQADIFVLVTASAKHAATDCVRRNRPVEKPILIPAGKGVASMLAAVRSYFERSS